MMRVAFLSILTFTVLQCSAQPWFPPAAEWYYAYSGGTGTERGHVHGTLGNDTLIAGSTWKQVHLVRTAAQWFQPPYTPYTLQLPSQFLRLDGDILQLFNVGTETFDTLYNMAAVPGDSWEFPSIAGWNVCSPEDRFTVIDTGTWVIDDTPLRWLAVEMSYDQDDDVQLVQDTIVERIGALGSFIYPHDFCAAALDGNEGGPVRCYADAEVSFERILWTPFSSDCAYLPNSISERSTVAFTLAPNPSAGMLRIDMGATVPNTSTLSVFNACGQLVTTEALVGTRTTLDLSELPAGPYMIQVRSGSAVHANVWMKE